MFDKMKDKAKDLMGEHSDKVEEYSDKGIDAAGDAVDDKTGGKYAEHVDKGQAIADEKIGE